MERFGRKQSFQTIRTAIRLSAMGVGIASVLNAGEIQRKQTPELHTSQTEQQLEQRPRQLVFYTHDQHVIFRKNVEMCDPLEKLSGGRDVKLVNLETNEVLVCVFFKNRKEATTK